MLQLSFVCEALTRRIVDPNDSDSDKLGKNFENVFNIFKKNIEKEIETTKDSEQKEDLVEVRNFLNQTLDVVTCITRKK